MKLAEIQRAEQLALDRERLIDLREKAASGRMGITIDGTYQDAGIVDAARMSVAGEYLARIVRIDAELLSLGVEIE